MREKTANFGDGDFGFSLQIPKIPLTKFKYLPLYSNLNIFLGGISLVLYTLSAAIPLGWQVCHVDIVLVLGVNV